MAREKRVEVDEVRFVELMQEQKERARAAGKFSVDQSQINEWQTLSEDDHSEFVGYDEFEAECSILAYRREGDRFSFTLNKTPFYAESGGQVADTGFLTNGNEFIHVVDVQKGNGSNIHYTDKLPNDIDGVWTARIDLSKRLETQKHHSATHLAHAALRNVLGDHVAQKDLWLMICTYVLTSLIMKQ